MAGGIRARGSGRWELRLSERDDTGRRRYHSRIVKGTEDDARAALDVWVAERRLDPARVTVADLLDRWYAHTAGGRTTRSNEEVLRVIRQHLQPALGAFKVCEVDVGVIERAYGRLRTEKALAEGTLRHVHYALRPALRMAVRWGWRPDNPAEQVELGPLRRKTVRPPRVEDVAALLAAALDEPNDLGLFLRLLAVTGARRAEVAALRWLDVDWLTSSVVIARALSDTENDALEVKEPKTAGSARRVSIDAASLDLLARMRDELARFAEADDHEWVFLAGNGQPVRPRAWTARFIRLRTRLGLGDVRLHDLRHLAASLMLDSGAGVIEVAGRLGHARPSTTFDVYGHLLGRRDSDLTDAVSTALNRSSVRRVGDDFLGPAALVGGPVLDDDRVETDEQHEVHARPELRRQRDRDHGQEPEHGGAQMDP
jgi:integrase